VTAQARRWRRRAALTVAGVTVGMAGMSGVGLAYWLATDSTHGAQAVAAILPGGATPTVAVTGNDVTVRFASAVTSPASGSTVLTDYLVRRYATPTGGQPAASFTCTTAGTDPSPDPAAGCAEPAVPDGSWYYTDSPTLANWTGPESSRSPVLVDTTLTIQTPAAGSILTSATPTISGTGPTGTTLTVEIYPGTAPAGAPVATVAGTVTAGRWSVASPALPDGGYTVLARHTDPATDPAASAPVESPPVGFRIDTTAPALSIDVPPSPSTGTTPTFTGSYGTAAGDDPATLQLQLLRNGTPTGAALTPTRSPATGRWTLPVGPLPDGTYTATVSQTDTAGHLGTVTSTPYRLDTTAPTVTLTSPTPDSTGPAATFTGTAGTTPGDAGTVTLTLTNPSTGAPVVTLTAPVAADGSWSTGPTTLPTGRYTVTASQTDILGHTGTSPTTNFTIATPPALTLDPVGVDDHGYGGYTTSTTPTLTGTAGTNPDDGPITILITDLTLGKSVGTPATTTPTGTRWTYTPPALARNDQYEILAYQTNTPTGLTTQTSTRFVIDQDPPRPTMTATTTGTTLTITGTAGTTPASTTTSADNPYLTLTLTNADTGQPLTTRQLPITPTGTYTYTQTGLTPGTRYAATATQTDTAGNTTTTKDTGIRP
jgi:large repetitive protein